MPQAIENTGAGEGNRTLVISLEGCCSTIELHPRRSHCDKRLRVFQRQPDAAGPAQAASASLPRRRDGISVRQAARQAGARDRSIPARSIARAFSWRGAKATVMSAEARSGWQESKGGAGSYSMPSWIARATASPAISRHGARVILEYVPPAD
jgi:hypothetical protein